MPGVAQRQGAPRRAGSGLKPVATGEDIMGKLCRIY